MDIDDPRMPARWPVSEETVKSRRYQRLRGEGTSRPAAQAAGRPKTAPRRAKANAAAGRDSES